MASHVPKQDEVVFSLYFPVRYKVSSVTSGNASNIMRLIFPIVRHVVRDRVKSFRIMYFVLDWLLERHYM
jgi:hypothetical protein